MVTDQSQSQSQGQQNEVHEGQNDEAADGQPGAAGPLSPRAGLTSFTPEQHEWMGRKIADERKATLEKFKASDEYKTMLSRARRADQVEGEARQRLEALTIENEKLKSDRAQALSQAEGALARAQITSLLSQLGVPTDRIQMAMLAINTTGVKVNLEQGVVAGAEEAVQQFVEEYPWFAGPGLARSYTQAPRPAPNLNGGVTSAPVTDEARIAAVMEEMRANGHGRL